jgi:hypothetical protein
LPQELPQQLLTQQHKKTRLAWMLSCEQAGSAKAKARQWHNPYTSACFEMQRIYIDIDFTILYIYKHLTGEKSCATSNKNLHTAEGPWPRREHDEDQVAHHATTNAQMRDWPLLGTNTATHAGGAAV